MVFLLSPAFCGGKRARLLFSERAAFPLAHRLQSAEPVSIGEVFSFISGLYFRGKLAYAGAFGDPARSRVITPSRGLVSPAMTVTLDDLKEFAEVDIGAGDERFLGPFTRDAASLAQSPEAVVLLGSVATGKYVDALIELLAGRLLFPADFVGRGDMSRGGLLLRRAREKRELDYVPVAGAVRHGPRPPKLSRLA